MDQLHKMFEEGNMGDDEDGSKKDFSGGGLGDACRKLEEDTSITYERLIELFPKKDEADKTDGSYECNHFPKDRSIELDIYFNGTNVPIILTEGDVEEEVTALDDDITAYQQAKAFLIEKLCLAPQTLDDLMKLVPQGVYTVGEDEVSVRYITKDDETKAIIDVNYCTFEATTLEELRTKINNLFREANLASRLLYGLPEDAERIGE